MMKSAAIVLAASIFATGCGQSSTPRKETASAQNLASDTIRLPPPDRKDGMSVEQALATRRSVREYAPGPLTLAEVGQLLWAGYGITQPLPGAPEWLRGGFKTAPSAGGLYPLELHVVASQVENLLPGVYRYLPEEHALLRVVDGDRRPLLYAAAGEQAAVRNAPASIVYSAVFSRTTGKYGKRGRERYVCMDAGHSAENVYLQCASLKLGTVAIGAFIDSDVKAATGMKAEEEPLYIMPVGRLMKEKQ